MAKSKPRLLVGVLLASLCSLALSVLEQDPMNPEGGYLRREYSLVQPYTGQLCISSCRILF